MLKECRSDVYFKLQTIEIVPVNSKRLVQMCVGRRRRLHTAISDEFDKLLQDANSQ